MAIEKGLYQTPEGLAVEEEAQMKSRLLTLTW